MTIIAQIALLAFGLLQGSRLVAEAFHPPSPQHAIPFRAELLRTNSNTALRMSVVSEDFDLPKLERGLTEMHRRDRRDFYGPDSWVRHRSPSRFFENLSAIPASKVVLMITKEVLAITFISYFVIAYNHLLVIGYDDFAGVHHPPIVDPFFPLLSLPKEPFLLSSPALGLLLVFRTNSCWQRWDEARKAWGVIVNNCRTIARKSSSWIMESELPYEEKQQLLTRVSDAVWAFPRAMRRHLLSEYEDELQFVADVRANLNEPFASDLIKYKRHRPSHVLFEMTCAINELPLDMFRRSHLDEATTELCNAMGGCDRLYTSPIPKFYNRFSSRFLSLWLAFLPLTLWNNVGEAWNHSDLPFICSTIALGMLGIELISMILEEPFSVLPLKNICDGIGKSAEEHLEYNIFESFEKPKIRIDERLKKHVNEDYTNPEYLEAMSLDTIIRHKNLATPVVSTVSSAPMTATSSSSSAATPPTSPEVENTQWDYLAQASAQMQDKLDSMDSLKDRKIDLLRDIEAAVKNSKCKDEGARP